MEPLQGEEGKEHPRLVQWLGYWKSSSRELNQVNAPVTTWLILLGYWLIHEQVEPLERKENEHPSIRLQEELMQGRESSENQNK